MINIIDQILPVQYKVHSVAKSLGVSRASITEMLKRFGFFVGRSREQVLSDEHLSAIKQIYSRALRKHYSKLLAKYGKSDQAKQELYSIFSGVILGQDTAAKFTDPSEWVIDEGLIEARFYQLLDAPYWVETGEDSNHVVIVRLMLRCLKACQGFVRSAMRSIIPPKLFFTYADEDHLSAAASFKQGFAVAGN